MVNLGLMNVDLGSQSQHETISKLERHEESATRPTTHPHD